MNSRLSNDLSKVASQISRMRLAIGTESVPENDFKKVFDIYEWKNIDFGKYDANTLDDVERFYSKRLMESEYGLKHYSATAGDRGFYLDQIDKYRSLVRIVQNTLKNTQTVQIPAKTNQGPIDDLDGHPINLINMPGSSYHDVEAVIKSFKLGEISVDEIKNHKNYDHLVSELMSYVEDSSGGGMSISAKKLLDAISGPNEAPVSIRHPDRPLDDRGTGLLVKKFVSPKQGIRLTDEQSVQDFLKTNTIDNIAKFIASKHIRLNNDILKISDQDGRTVAHVLAKYPSSRWTTDDKDILNLEDKKGNTVAGVLAENCSYNRWSTNDAAILKLPVGSATVAHYLASFAWKTKWKTNDKAILSLRSHSSWSDDTVAHDLASRARESGFMTNDKDILMMRNKQGDTVAHKLASSLGAKSGLEGDILGEKGQHGFTVADHMSDFGRRMVPKYAHPYISDEFKEKLRISTRSISMEKKLIANELRKLASLIQGMEFNTKAELDAYLKEHPAADKSHHSVKQQEDEKKETTSPAPVSPAPESTGDVAESLKKDLGGEKSESHSNAVNMAEKLKTYDPEKPWSADDAEEDSYHPVTYALLDGGLDNLTKEDVDKFSPEEKESVTNALQTWADDDGELDGVLNGDMYDEMFDSASKVMDLVGMDSKAFKGKVDKLKNDRWGGNTGKE